MATRQPTLVMDNVSDCADPMMAQALDLPDVLDVTDLAEAREARAITKGVGLLRGEAVGWHIVIDMVGVIAAMGSDGVSIHLRTCMVVRMPKTTMCTAVADEMGRV